MSDRDAVIERVLPVVPATPDTVAPFGQILGYDPAVGSSVMITAVTDSGGFFIFLGLATLFLL